MKLFRVLSSSSLGYTLFDEESKESSLHPKRGHLGKKESILIGDYVALDEEGYIASIAPRKNFLERPRLANSDGMLILISLKEPEFSSYLLDKFLSLCSYRNIEASIVLTKKDLCTEAEIEKYEKVKKYYEGLGYRVYLVSLKDPEDPELLLLKEAIRYKAISLMGQTGVGKSSLINALFPSLKRKVDEHKNIVYGRGRHTTKEVILLPYKDGYLFDTAGFSECEIKGITPKILSVCFPGFEAYSEECQFNDCLHLPSSQGCMVRKKVKEGVLNEASYEDYLKIMEEAKKNDVWKKKKPSSDRPF